MLNHVSFPQRFPSKQVVEEGLGELANPYSHYKQLLKQR